ncbi:MAG TPA: hypothetical protein VIG47_10675, partial [Gemmatimonadaceae bacterium]
MHVSVRARVEEITKSGVHMPRGFWGTLSDDYERAVKQIVRNGMEEVRNDRPVRVECPKCHRQATIAGDVQRWTCLCSPVERYAFQTYIE